MNHLTIISAFRQGTVSEGGNCASIALIKAAMDKYGVDDVFQTYRAEDTRHHVTLRDGHSLSFTDEDVAKVAKRADFHVRKGETDAQTQEHRRILARAHLYFCAMVMRVIEIGEAGEGVGVFGEAIAALNDGAITTRVPDLLGLAYEPGPLWARTKGQRGVVAWNLKHAVFASNGSYDHYGESRSIRWKYPNRLFLR